jgi:hypothetical protein
MDSEIKQKFTRRFEPSPNQGKFMPCSFLRWVSQPGFVQYNFKDLFKWVRTEERSQAAFLGSRQWSINPIIEIEVALEDATSSWGVLGPTTGKSSTF